MSVLRMKMRMLWCRERCDRMVFDQAHVTIEYRAIENGASAIYDNMADIVEAGSQLSRQSVQR